MTSSQRILTILAIVLLASLAGLTVWANEVPSPPVLAVLPLIPLTAVLILAAMFGRLAALCGGFVYGLAVTLVLLPDHLSVLPLTRELGAALLQPLALANYLAAPLLGFIAGSGARLRQARQRQLRRKNDDLSRANQDMRSRLADHERTLATLSQSRLYKKAWTDLIDESGESESLIGLFLTVLLNQRRRRRHAGLIAPAATPPCRDITFSHLIDLTCPDILAVLQLDGAIHAVNARLFAIFCYPADTPVIGRSVTDLLIPEDAPRALANIARAVGSDFDPGETYEMRASDGRFQTLVVSPRVYLECLGDPLVLALRIACDQGSAADKPEPARPDPTALAELQVWCLSADRLTLYISPDLAGRLSESTALMLGKPIDHYLIRKQAARFHDFMANCQDGQSHTIDLVMRPHKGDRTILSLTAWPAIGAQGHLIGLTLLARDITERRIVEEALQHRLAIEQMISAFSTRFISIKADAMDQEIREVVRRIGAFEEAIETTVEIYRSGKISQPVRLTVKQEQPAGQAQADKQEQETVSVPIIIDDEPLGHFSFSVAKYRSGWLNNDLELIRLAGEIIINSLIRKQNEVALSINENRLATTLQSIGDAVIATDTAGRIIIVNRTAEQLTGWSEQEILLRPIAEVFRVAGQDNRSEDTAREIHPLTETDDSLVLTDRDGRQIFVAVSRAVIQDEAGAIFGEVVVFRDVTQKKKEVDEIRYISFHDRLTGLYNRAFFEEELTRLNTPRQFPITIILGDCNGLKIANDIFGHLEGDKLLQTIAGILRKATRKEDIVARWGGDEFAIILPRTNETAASAIRERILSLCDTADPYPILPSLALAGLSTEINEIRQNRA